VVIARHLNTTPQLSEWAPQAFLEISEKREREREVFSLRKLLIADITFLTGLDNNKWAEFMTRPLSACGKNFLQKFLTKLVGLQCRSGPVENR
jgi:hypothetical protein